MQVLGLFHCQPQLGYLQHCLRRKEWGTVGGSLAVPGTETGPAPAYVGLVGVVGSEYPLPTTFLSFLGW